MWSFGHCRRFSLTLQSVNNRQTTYGKRCGLLYVVPPFRFDFIRMILFEMGDFLTSYITADNLQKVLYYGLCLLRTKVL